MSITGRRQSYYETLTNSHQARPLSGLMGGGHMNHALPIMTQDLNFPSSKCDQDGNKERTLDPPLQFLVGSGSIQIGHNCPRLVNYSVQGCIEQLSGEILIQPLYFNTWLLTPLLYILPQSLNVLGMNVLSLMSTKLVE